MRNERGFTLLELLMVIVIIAVLAAMALPQYIRATEKSRGAEALQLLGAVRTSQERYRSFSPTNVYAANVGDVDFEAPVTTRYWGAGTSTFNATHAIYTRNGGQYTGSTIGIRFNNGNICGNFTPVLGNSVAAPCT